MGEAQQNVFRNDNLGARRTPSKVVSDAFGFLNNKSYSDKNGLVRIHSSYSDSNLAYVDSSSKPSVWLQPDVYIPDETEEFTIVTSVEKSPQRKLETNTDDRNAYSAMLDESPGKQKHFGDRNAARRDSLPTMYLTDSHTKTADTMDNHVARINGTEISINEKTNDKDEFVIVDYLEDYNKRMDSGKGVNKGNLDNKTVTDNLDKDSVIMKHEGNKGSLNTDARANSDEGADDNEPRRSVNIDGNIVELRSHNRDTKPARAPTWKQNQMIVSEAFNFLKDLEGGDTVSVINVPIDDKSDAESQRNIDITRNNKGNNEFNDASGKIDNGVCNGISNTPNKNTTNLNSFGKSTNLNSFGKPVSAMFESRVSSDQYSDPNSPNRFSVSSERDDKLGELGVSRLRERRKSPRKDSEDNDDGDSSDEDKGVYRESFRKSTWLYVGDNSDISQLDSSNSTSKESGYVSLSDLNLKTCDNDSVFGDQDLIPSESPVYKQPSHNRTDSTATTVSEREFRNAYHHVSKKIVKRADSEQEYKRFSSKFYDHEKVFTIEKNGSSGYGIHIIGSHPAVITQVDEGSPGASAGVQEGQIVISINNVNVLDQEHDEIIRLVQENSTKLVLEVGCSDVAHIRDLELPIMSGFLMKQTSTVIFKSWKRRFFILRRDNCLYYYKTEKDVDPLGAIPLTGYTVSRHGDTSKFGFKAEKFDNRTYFFMADTRDDMAKWVGAMNEAALRSKHKKDVWLDVTTNNVGLPALEIRKPDCTGYLYKMGRVTKRWKRHYCVLKDACIYHYKSASSKEAIGVAHLHGYTVDLTGLPGKKLSFCLEPPDPQMRSFSFYAENETDKIRWTEALQTSIQKWVKVG